MAVDADGQPPLIFSLPDEILCQILSYCHEKDLSHVSKIELSCRRLRRCLRLPSCWSPMHLLVKSGSKGCTHFLLELCTGSHQIRKQLLIPAEKFTAAYLTNLRRFPVISLNILNPMESLDENLLSPLLESGLKVTQLWLSCWCTTKTAQLWTKLILSQSDTLKDLRICGKRFDIDAKLLLEAVARCKRLETLFVLHRELNYSSEDLAKTCNRLRNLRYVSFYLPKTAHAPELVDMLSEHCRAGLWQLSLRSEENDRDVVRNFLLSIPRKFSSITSVSFDTRHTTDKEIVTSDMRVQFILGFLNKYANFWCKRELTLLYMGDLLNESDQLDLLADMIFSAVKLDVVHYFYKMHYKLIVKMGQATVTIL